MIDLTDVTRRMRVGWKSSHRAQKAAEHPIVRSMEPGESWAWCYTDKVVLE